MPVTLLKPSDVVAEKDTHVRDVHCPYCAVGTAPITIIGPSLVTVGTRQEIDMRPKRCDTCKRDFRVGYRQTFVGIRMEG